MTTAFATEDYARKIRMMLDKAEATEEPEAGIFREKAYELMEKYAIDQSMVDAHAPEERDELVHETFAFRGRFAEANGLMSYYVATALGMRGTRSKGNGYYDLTLYGWKSDMDRFKLLNASLQIQAVRAQQSWERRVGLRESALPQWDKFKARRSFLLGFGSGVQAKLEAAQQVARAEVATERAAAHGSTVEEESTGVALVLRSRQETVDDWFDTTIMGYKPGSKKKKRKGRSLTVSYNAYGSGTKAGRQADTGQGKVGGNRRSLNA